MDRRLASRRSLLSTTVALAGGTLLPACGTTTPGQRSAEPARSTLTGRLETWISAYFPISGEPMWREIYDSFRAKHPGLNVVIGEGTTRGDAEVQAKFATVVAAGDAPDVMHIGGIFAQTYARQGTLTNLEPYFKASKTLVKADLWPSWLADGTYKGQPYSLPFAGDARVMYLHTGVWQSAGLDSSKPPKTWAELEEVTRRLVHRNAQGDLERIGFNPGTAPWLWPFWQLGGEQIDPSGERVILDQGDAGVRAIEWELKLYDMQGGRDAFTRFHLANGGNEQNSGNPTAGNYIQLFEQGKLGMYVNTFSTRSEQFRQRGFPDSQWAFTPYPLPPGGRQVNYGGSHALGMPAIARNKDAGWAFMEHFSLPENDLRFATRYDRVPMRRATSGSETFHKNDPFLKLQHEVAAGRKFLTAVPGALELVAFWNTPFVDAYTGRRSPADAIRQTARDMQQALDRFLGKA